MNHSDTDNNNGLKPVRSRIEQNKLSKMSNWERREHEITK